ncbi:MAG: CPBP family intramembrane metalloprotease [Lachnospiraceae bacterium]|nr:CPBP family intramembrane metalloprotease [Lachnospiraceae bacterium]
MKKDLSPNRKILRKIVIGIAIYCGAYFLSLIALYSFSGYLKYGNALIGTVASLVAGFGAFLSITGDEKTKLLFDSSARYSKKPFFALFVILTAFTATVLFNYLFSLIPWDKLGDKNIVQDNEAFYSIPFYLRLISYVIIGPFAEEVLFRGVIFFRFRKLMPLWGAALASALFFGIYHGNLMQGIYAFIMGFLICFFMDQGGSIAYALAFHMTANLISNLCYEYEYINNVVYSIPVIAVSTAYLVVAIILCYVFTLKLTKKDKKC